nr:BSD-like protein [Tanacetum cinerariifolium]
DGDIDYVLSTYVLHLDINRLFWFTSVCVMSPGILILRLFEDDLVSDVSTVSNVRQDLYEWQQKHVNLVLTTIKFGWLTHRKDGVMKMINERICVF